MNKLDVLIEEIQNGLVFENRTINYAYTVMMPPLNKELYKEFNPFLVKLVDRFNKSGLNIQYKRAGMKPPRILIDDVVLVDLAGGGGTYKVEVPVEYEKFMDQVFSKWQKLAQQYVEPVINIRKG